MATNTHSIHSAVEADLPAIAQNVHESKLALTINRLLWKDWPNDQRSQYTSAIESSFKNPSGKIFKAVDDESGNIVGHIVLTHRKPAESESAVDEGHGTAKTAEVSAGMNPEVLAAVMRFVQETNTVRDIEHLELTHLFVKPTYRRRGIGSQLVRLGIERAQEAGIVLAVGAEPEARDFFLSQGFKDTKYSDVDLSQWAPKYSGFGIFRFTRMVRSYE